jgi:hypothetical protein
MTSVVPLKLSNGSRASAPEKIYPVETKNVVAIRLSPQGLKAVLF